MKENYLQVQQGFHILLSSLSGFIGQEMNKTFKARWWKVVLVALEDQRDLPMDGTYGDLIDSLDIANCIRLLDREWNDVFRDILPPTCRAWAKELMGVRNIVSHIGSQDLDQPMAERALDTMALLCNEIDKDGAEEIREIYKEVRAKAGDVYRPAPIVYAGLQQPESESKRGALREGSLLQLVDSEVVERTQLTRKVTYGGKTIVYPVYRVRLDALYYNDQNDRIATWISRYESENGKDALSDLDVDIYNRIIEDFIYDSNPESIVRTQNNIDLVGQREPGVTLADGRIVDGNRRFTCLRRLQRKKNIPYYFETVLMDMDIREDKKQIKLLELAIQHGEEQKVDYDQIDYVIGTYRDIVQTNLLTVEEYAESTNETNAEVRNRIEIAELICEFLEHVGLPGEYHVARDYQVYALFQEMRAPLKQLDEDDKSLLKTITFNNVMMKAEPDQRKFIRDIRNLIKNAAYKEYFDDQRKLGEIIHEKLNASDIRTKEDLDRFAFENSDIVEELQISMERALKKARSKVLKNRSSENVSKSIALMMEIDPRLFGGMDIEEKEELKTGMNELKEIIGRFLKQL